MAINSEILFTPRIDENKMRQEGKKQEKIMANTAKQIGDDYKRELTDGMEDAADSGSKAIGSKLRMVAASLALVVGSVIKDTFDMVTNGAEEVEERLRQRIESMKDITSTAEGLGIDSATYAALTLAGRAQGIEQDDTRGLLSGFVGALERPEMAAYKDAAEQNGIEKSFLDFLASMSKLSPEQSAQYLNQVFGDEDALKASKFLDPIRELSKNGKPLTVEGILNAMLGGGLNMAGLRRSFIDSEGNIKTVMRNDALDAQREILLGVSGEEATGINRMTNARRDEQNAQEEAFNIKVEKFVVEKEMNVAQIKAGLVVADALASQFTLVGESGKELVNDIKADKSTPELAFDVWSLYNNAVYGNKAWVEVTTALQKALGILPQDAKTMTQEAEDASKHNQTRRDAGSNAMK
ncbi:hypothetical protein [Vibrio harveyi]|uniref:hypothetical protein n=1 Tax=Vibrio harveyi TaxID=669 RepID=UPI003CFA885F